MDIVPTVLDVLGIEAPPGLSGRSLLGLLVGRGEAPGAPSSYFEALTASINRRWAPLRGVRDGGLKYVDLPLPELYDLAADPAEAHNLAASRPQELERLHAGLQAFQARDRGPAPRRRARRRSSGCVRSATPPPLGRSRRRSASAPTTTPSG